MIYRIFQQGTHKELETFGSVGKVADFNDQDHPHHELWKNIMGNIIGYIRPTPRNSELVLLSEIKGFTWITTLEFDNQEDLIAFYPLIKMVSEEERLKDLVDKALGDIQPYKETQPLFKEKDTKAKRPYYNKNRPF